MISTFLGDTFNWLNIGILEQFVIPFSFRSNSISRNAQLVLLGQPKQVTWVCLNYLFDVKQQFEVVIFKMPQAHSNE